jgi:transcriptional regulator with XRE-family HTH domain
VTQIGSRAKALRERRGESREAVARRADISTTTYFRIEKGENEPSLATLIGIAAALEVTLDELVSDEPVSAA